MRAVIALLLVLATPAAAWEFTPSPVCTLSHETAEAALEITYDPSRAEPYAIAIRRAVPWPEGPVFAIRYAGARSLTIQTTRHQLSADRRTLTVTDRGFGNVLDGIGLNDTATAMLAGAEVVFPLDGARAPLAAFRDCRPVPVA
jgi:hypothetical protein